EIVKRTSTKRFMNYGAPHDLRNDPPDAQDAWSARQVARYSAGARQAQKNRPERARDDAPRAESVRLRAANSVRVRHAEARDLAPHRQGRTVPSGHGAEHRPATHTR